MSTGRIDNLSHLLNDSRLTVIEVDIVNLEAIRPHFQGIEWVFHIAALADIVPLDSISLDISPLERGWNHQRIGSFAKCQHQEIHVCSIFKLLRYSG